MTKQIATHEQLQVPHTEIPDTVLADRIESAQSNLEFATGERREQVLRNLTHLLFEQESRNGRPAFGPYTETGKASEEYHELHEARKEERLGFLSLKREAREGLVASS